MDKETIIIVGSGFGGYTLYQNIDKSKYDVKIISIQNTFLYTPLLYKKCLNNNLQIETSIPTLIVDEIIDLDFVNGKCKLVSRTGNTYLSNHVVLSYGSCVNTFNILGVDKYCYFLKNISDAQKIHDKLKTFKHSKPKIAIIGSGNVGIELTGLLIDQNLYDITIIEALNKPLPMFDYEVGSYVEQFLKNNNVNVILKNPVTKIDNEKIYLKSGNTVQYDIAIWCAGIKPNSLTYKINSKFNLRGITGLITEHDLQVEHLDNVYAIGDCAQNQYPKTAQIAHQQGKFLAKGFNDLVNQKSHIILGHRVGTIGRPEKSIPTFKYNNMGSFCYIGRETSIYIRDKYFVGGKFADYLNRGLHYYYVTKFEINNTIQS